MPHSCYSPCMRKLYWVSWMRQHLSLLKPLSSGHRSISPEFVAVCAWLPTALGLCTCRGDLSHTGVGWVCSQCCVGVGVCGCVCVHICVCMCCAGWVVIV